MTTDRGRLHALRALITGQDAGGYTLPEQILTAHAALEQLGGIAQPEPPAYGVEQAADDVLADLTAGRDVDLTGYARRLRDTAEAAQVRDHAQVVLRYAHDHATATALATATDHHRAVVVDHLRPAFQDVLATAEKAATVLAGHLLDPRSVLSAPARVRTAYLEMQRLADRLALLRQAQRHASVAADRHPAHDHAGEYATLAHPHALTGYTPGKGRPPVIDYPTDPVALMLWLTGPAQVAEPWLPLAEEQDEAWQRDYGNLTTKRQYTLTGESIGGY